MGLVPDNAEGSGAVKTPLVRKGVDSKSASSNKAKKSSGGGMMFTFVHEDGSIQTRIAKDPVFDGVVGFQKDFEFLTQEMVEHIKSEVAKVDSDMDMGSYVYPLEHDQAVALVYNYTPCMKKCKRGETAGAFIVTYVDI